MAACYDPAPPPRPLARGFTRIARPGAASGPTGYAPGVTAERPEPVLHVALLEPKIPQNTGSIGRLTLALGARLHLVGPLGFDTDEKACRRAGLDYWKHVDLLQHPDLAALERALPPGSRTWVFSAHAPRTWVEAEYRAGDCLLFGDEVLGLPRELVEAAGERAVRIPLVSPRVRSLNLACAVSMAVGEALRQVGAGLEAPCRPS